jgi:hypothetical protein
MTAALVWLTAMSVVVLAVRTAALAASTCRYSPSARAQAAAVQ